MENILHNFWTLLKYNPVEPLLFNSGFFLFFFLFVTVFAYFFVNHKRAKLIFLTLASLYFYYKSSGVYFLLIILSSLIDYIAGREIHKTENSLKRRVFLIISLVMNLGILGYFKYTNFFLDTINSLHLGHFDLLNIFLPVGVSFFTFQSMSYTIDIYRRQLEPEEKFLDFLFFVSFFPQLVAGPIVRASHFLKQIHEYPVINKKEIGYALFLIMAGLLKKTVIADFLSINFVDRVFEWPTRFTGVENLMAIYGYVLQIYCDFSGYSDMAIGLALLLGFRLPVNFNAPYRSVTITEFWRRWHISLSSWLRDYLYIPLGGNRKGKGRTYFNLMATMVLGGLWHGASWRFVFWGTIHGGALAIERLLKYPKWINEKSWGVKIFGVILTFHIWAFSMIFFRAQSYKLAFDMIHQITHFFHAEVFPQFVSGYPMVVAIFIIGMLSHFTPVKLEERMKAFLGSSPVIVQSLILAIVIFIVVQFKTSNIQPFIYFQF